MNKNYKVSFIFVSLLILSLLTACTSKDELTSAKQELEKLKSDYKTVSADLEKVKKTAAEFQQQNKDLTDQLDLYRENNSNGNAAETVSESAISNPVEKEYAENFVEINNLETKWHEDILYGNKVAGYTFDLKNKGKKDVEYLTVTVYFKDKSGSTIAEASLTPINPSGIFDNDPLKANYSWKMDTGIYYQAKDVSKEWVEGSAEAVITELRFVKE
ncbi:hypothetical protein [Paenibacillus gallinarum]|uniref:Lipoprotein n=1 Tax=Paenibacillus gallinarum TaxID=2762232 RepID=A0ABR8SXG3_9BACL|nr:hypothetical protein [Paenibacillus gallinarum]MBD7967784.1 hypothetical protein [Paenibacillus gallinarum]